MIDSAEFAYAFWSLMGATGLIWLGAKIVHAIQMEREAKKYRPWEKRPVLYIPKRDDQ